MKRIILGLAAAGLLFAAQAQAQARAQSQNMTVQEFITTANGIPRNATALLRSDTRRVMGEMRGAFQTIRREQTQARAAGRSTPTCLPEKVSLSPDAVLARFNAIPAQRRQSMTVTQAVREWMAERYPCPAA